MRRFFRHLAAEIRRRRVLRVVAIYAVTAWLVLQIAETTFAPLGFPAWSMRALIVATIIGFPISFLLAWIIDIRSDGLIFDLPLWVGDSDHPRPQKRSDLVYASLLGVLLVGGTYTAFNLLFENIGEQTVEVDWPEAPPNSIAVLAFENFDGHADTDYFAAGLAEEILNILAGMKELRVAARTSSFRFRGEQIDIREVAKRLGVRHVLEGSARRDSDRIRMTAQLISGDDGFHDWSKTYERPLDDIFAVQQEIASAVANELRIALSVDSREQLQKRPTENTDAYIYYLQGRGRLRSSKDADVMATASQLFKKSLEIDPTFSRAHAGICEVHLRLYDIGNDIDDFKIAEAACDEASRLDPGLSSEINLALGKLYHYRGWYQRAEEQLNKAIAITPMAVDAYIELAEIQMAQSRGDSVEQAFLRAVDLQRNYWRAHESLARYYYRNERYEEAAKSYEIATSLAPDVASAFAAKGAVYWMLGEADKARLAYDKSLALKPSRQGYTNMGLRYYYAGQFDAAVDMQMKALEFAPDDHRVWGRLAESYRFVAGSEEESQHAYQRAADLAASNLEINDSDWETTGLLALYYAHLERVADARQLAERSVSLSGRNPESLYYQALARLEYGDRNGALEVLEEAVAADEKYSQFIETDPDLQSLRDSDRFLRLLPDDEKQ